MACVIDLQLRHNKPLSCFELLQLCNPQWHFSEGARPCSRPTLRYFGPILNPALCHTLSHISGPPKVCHTSWSPQFLVVHAYILYMSLQGFCVSSWGILFGGLIWGLLPGRFRPGVFWSFPLLSE